MWGNLILQLQINIFFFHSVFPVNDNFSLTLCLILHAEKHDRRKKFFKTKEIKIFDISDMFLILHKTTFLETLSDDDVVMNICIKDGSFRYLADIVSRRSRSHHDTLWLGVEYSRSVAEDRKILL